LIPALKRLGVVILYINRLASALPNHCFRISPDLVEVDLNNNIGGPRDRNRMERLLPGCWVQRKADLANGISNGNG
jgi:hypothetical protein